MHIPSLYFSFFSCLFITPPIFLFFFFNDTATTEIYTLSLHDALPIFPHLYAGQKLTLKIYPERLAIFHKDRKSTRLNSSHLGISYAVFCLKKKKHPNPTLTLRSSPQEVSGGALRG